MNKNVIRASGLPKYIFPRFTPVEEFDAIYSIGFVRQRKPLSIHLGTYFTAILTNVFENISWQHD